MYERRVILGNATGFHIRPATLFMEAASRFRSVIEVAADERTADGKSAISLMLLEAPQGTQLTIRASGEDEVAAVDALVDLVDRHFDERGARPETRS
jgi:phosphocarrier protein HPr